MSTDAEPPGRAAATADPLEGLIARSRDRTPVRWDDPVRGSVSFVTLFSAGLTPTDGLTAGIAEIEPGGGSRRPHRHVQPELYYILEGRGVLTLDGRQVIVEAGAAVLVPGNAEHGLRNDGDTPLKLLYVFPADRFEDVVYRFSD